MSNRPAAVRANRSPIFDASPLTLSGIVADYGLIGAVGIGALLLAIILAPLIGGYPPGIAYGGDVSLNALRALVCIVGVCRPRLVCSVADSGSRSQMLFSLLFGLPAALTVLSLLVHSRFLTNPVLLFAMLPAALDWLCYAILAILTWQLARQDRRILMLLIGALAIGAAGTAVAVARSYGNAVQDGMRGFRASGTFFSPNFAGGFLGLCLPVLAAACLAARERLAALVLGAVTALAFGGLVATGSRAGIAITGVGLITGIALALISQRKGEQSLPWARVGALIAAFVVLGFAFRGPLTARAEGSGGGADEHSGAFRTMTWKGTLAMSKAHPLLGVGPGTFYVHYPAYAIVARTDLAHSSYLQIAGEQGFPALLTAIAAIISALVAGAASLLRRVTREEDALLRLLLCGSIGGVLAGALRSIFDSEWTLLGNGIPFWTMTGLAAAGIPMLVSANSAETVKAGSPLVLRISAALGLVFSVLLLQGVQARDTIQAQFQQTRQSVPQASVWPPDPNILLYTGQPDEAAKIEPSGKRWYQLAESLNRNGKPDEAIEMYRRAAEVDPNAMQTWRKLAVTLQEQGRSEQARDAWARIASLDEGMVGKVRAIPELREIHPAFAYAALADDAVTRGRTGEAATYFQKAAEVIEDYSRTTPQYQQMELLSAMMTGADVTARREETRSLYESVIARWIKLQPERRAELEARQGETLAQLDKFAKPETAGTISPESNTSK